jgi:IstB-like ATP binding protein
VRLSLAHKPSRYPDPISGIRQCLSLADPRVFWEICDDRYQTRSTIFTSQLPVSRWHEQIGDPTIADGILDRLVHNAHRIEMRGESMRKKRNPPPDENKEGTKVSFGKMSVVS